MTDKNSAIFHFKRNVHFQTPFIHIRKYSNTSLQSCDNIALQSNIFSRCLHTLVTNCVCRFDICEQLRARIMIDLKTRIIILLKVSKNNIHFAYRCRFISARKSPLQERQYVLFRDKSVAIGHLGKVLVESSKAVERISITRSCLEIHS